MNKIDHIHQMVDSMLWLELLEPLDNLLFDIDPRKLSEDEILSYLTATLPAKSKLQYRQRFKQRSAQALEARGVDELETARMLYGL